MAHVLKRLEELRMVRLAPGATDSVSAVLPVCLPTVAEARPGGKNPEIATMLELLALRDRYIQAELLTLQRTLSRQTFRGAESARRLVRRLARRAEQNALDAESLRTTDTH